MLNIINSILLDTAGQSVRRNILMSIVFSRLMYLGYFIGVYLKLLALSNWCPSTCKGLKITFPVATCRLKRILNLAMTIIIAVTNGWTAHALIICPSRRCKGCINLHHSWHSVMSRILVLILLTCWSLSTFVLFFCLIFFRILYARQLGFGYPEESGWVLCRCLGEIVESIGLFHVIFELTLAFLSFIHILRLLVCAKPYKGIVSTDEARALPLACSDLVAEHIFNLGDFAEYSRLSNSLSAQSRCCFRCSWSLSLYNCCVVYRLLVDIYT
jgi:hypothetical protein